MYGLGRLRLKSKRLHLELTIFKAIVSTFFFFLNVGLFPIPARPDTTGWWPLGLNSKKVEKVANWVFRRLPKMTFTLRYLKSSDKKAFACGASDLEADTSKTCICERLKWIIGSLSLASCVLPATQSLFCIEISIWSTLSYPALMQNFQVIANQLCLFCINDQLPSPL